MGINSLPYLAVHRPNPFFPFPSAERLRGFTQRNSSPAPSEIVDYPAIHLAGFPLNGGKSRVTGRLRVTVGGEGGGEGEGEAGISWTIRNTARPHFFLAATREINNHNEGTELFAAGRAAPWKKSVVICTARMTF